MDGGGKDCGCKILGPLGRSGPLGVDNARQQLGRSFKLRLGNSSQQIGEVPLNRESILVFTGAGVEDEETGKAVGDAYASATSITCHIDMTNEQPEPQPQPGDIIGEIEWGTDGTSAKAQFDWKHGTVVQVSGSFVRVSAFLEGVPGLDPDEEEVAQTVGGHIGYYPVTRCLPTRTFILGAIADGAVSALIRIPRFACKVFFVPVPFDGSLLVTEFIIDRAGALIIGENLATSPGGLVIPGGAHYVRIANRGATPLTDSRLIFELAL